MKKNNKTLKIYNMKNLIIVTIACVFFTSCTKDDEAISIETNESESNFFNLKVGNVWVYKEYREVNQYGAIVDTSEFNFTNIDTVRITEKIRIDDREFYKMTSNRYGIDGRKISSTNTSFVKVNSYGHLVNSEGATIHPGKDKNLDNYNIGLIDFYYDKGSFEYELVGPENISVEGKSYNTYYLKGIFTFTLNTFPDIENRNREYGSYYQEGVGLVKRVANSFSSNLKIETRLVSYYNELD